MLHRKGVSKLAVCAALACSTVAGAEDLSGTGRNQDIRPLYLQDATQPTTGPATAPSTEPAPAPPRPLMALFESIGIGKPLEDAGITIGGYIEGGYTVATNDPPGHVLAGRVFDTKNNKFVLDQFDLFFDRPVDYQKAAQNHTFDIGGHVDFIYGWDSGLIHSSGIFDSPAVAGVTNGYYASRTHPENQADFNQAYVDVALPVGTGLRIRAGKFVTLLGWEVINPTGNAFYSHSYMFGYAIPFTHTGIMGEYKINDDWQIDAGITRGWNQSLNDNNGCPDFLGGITFTPQESDALKKWKFILNLSEGPQATNDNSNWWTVLDFQAIYTASDKLSYVVNIDYGDAPGATASGAAQWYGIAGYAAYVMNDYLTTNVRAEYYGDTKSFTLGPGGAANLYEVTLNLQVKPMPHNNIGQNLVIRPEIRLDYAEKAFFDGGSKHYQATFGVDAYFMF
jgi:putative OmpL-like beta-barrel porin-2